MRKTMSDTFKYTIDEFWEKLKELFGVFFKWLACGVCLCLILLFFYAIGTSIDEEVKERKAANSFSLAEWNKVEAHNHDYTSAELLARKRADYQFGVGQYEFTSTNVGNAVFWKAQKK